MHEQTLAIHAGYDKDSMGTMAVPKTIFKKRPIA